MYEVIQLKHETSVNFLEVLDGQHECLKEEILAIHQVVADTLFWIEAVSQLALVCLSVWKYDSSLTRYEQWWTK